MDGRQAVWLALLLFGGCSDANSNSTQLASEQLPASQRRENERISRLEGKRATAIAGLSPDDRDDFFAAKNELLQSAVAQSPLPSGIFAVVSPEMLACEYALAPELELEKLTGKRILVTKAEWAACMPTADGQNYLAGLSTTTWRWLEAGVVCEFPISDEHRIADMDSGQSKLDDFQVTYDGVRTITFMDRPMKVIYLRDCVFVPQAED